MIRENRVLSTLRSGGRAVGTFAKMHDPASVEILGLAGFEFVVLDTEHASMDRQALVDLLRAADAADTVPLVRLRNNDHVEILQALDAGAADGNHENTPLSELSLEGLGDTGCRRSDEDPIIGGEVLPAQRAGRERGPGAVCRPPVVHCGTTAAAEAGDREQYEDGAIDDGRI